MQTDHDKPDYIEVDVSKTKFIILHIPYFVSNEASANCLRSMSENVRKLVGSPCPPIVLLRDGIKAEVIE